ncbi:alpha/beta-hydrolase [Neocallimastix lanati (nom. inval.)]|nr:alpha/beta-hydrolase [Neocallimastix sp. JGI-2020a]
MKFNKLNLVSFIIEALLTTKALTKANYRPVVIWHGMGDSCCNPQSIGGFVDTLQELLPDTLIYSLNVSDSESEIVERKNSYFGNVNNHVDYVCSRLHEDDLYPQLKDGFNALGFSQGGQFLRAYVERCNDPPVYNLITYGAQHNGVSTIPGCVNDDSNFCARMKFLVSTNVYGSFVQNNIVQAQYFKSIENYDEYLEKSIFLADINNEREIKNPNYKENMLSLNKFVMIKFEDDDMVIPPTSSWFGWIDEFDELIPFNKTDTYKEDWLGLQTMEKQNQLDFINAPGNHMQVDLDFFIENVFHPYLDELIDDGDNSNDDDDDDDDHDDNDTDVEEINKTNKNIKSQNINDYLDSFFIKVQH